MVFDCSEIDSLRLTAWCKDLPQNITQYFPTVTVTQLENGGYIRKSKCGLSWRITPKGNEVLAKAGFKYTQDKQYLGKGKVLTRRLEMAEIILFLYLLEADVFLENPTQYKPNTIAFLPSFTIRRSKGTNVLGGTRLSGFLYAPKNVFIPYHIADGDGGLYPHTEQVAFTGEHLTNRKQPVVVYTGKTDLSSLLHAVDHAVKVKFKTKACNFHEAMERFSYPVSFVPLSNDGMRQLRIMCQPDYKKRLVKMILNDKYEPSKYSVYDAIRSDTKEPYIIGLDFNIKGINKAIEISEGRKVHVIVLEFQQEAIKKYLKGKNVSLYGLKTAKAESILDLSKQLREPVFTHFETKEGGEINAAILPAYRNTGKQSDNKIQEI